MTLGRRRLTWLPYWLQWDGAEIAHVKVPNQHLRILNQHACSCRLPASKSKNDCLLDCPSGCNSRHVSNFPRTAVFVRAQTGLGTIVFFAIALGAHSTFSPGRLYEFPAGQSRTLCTNVWVSCRHFCCIRPAMEHRNAYTAGVPHLEAAITIPFVRPGLARAMKMSFAPTPPLPPTISLARPASPMPCEAFKMQLDVVSDVIVTFMGKYLNSIIKKHSLNIH